MKKLEAAYAINPTHSVVLNQLSNHFFFKKDYKTVHSLAVVAYHGTEVPEIKAESCYYLARNYHAQEEYEKAFEFYAQALRLWKDYPLAKFGMFSLLSAV